MPFQKFFNDLRKYQTVSQREKAEIIHQSETWGLEETEAGSEDRNQKAEYSYHNAENHHKAELSKYILYYRIMLIVHRVL